MWEKQFMSEEKNVGETYLGDAKKILVIFFGVKQFMAKQNYVFKTFMGKQKCLVKKKKMGWKQLCVKKKIMGENKYGWEQLWVKKYYGCTKLLVWNIIDEKHYVWERKKYVKITMSERKLCFSNQKTQRNMFYQKSWVKN